MPHDDEVVETDVEEPVDDSDVASAGRDRNRDREQLQEFFDNLGRRKIGQMQGSTGSQIRQALIDQGITTIEEAIVLLHETFGVPLDTLHDARREVRPGGGSLAADAVRRLRNQGALNPLSNQDQTQLDRLIRDDGFTLQAAMDWLIDHGVTPASIAEAVATLPGGQEAYTDAGLAEGDPFDRFGGLRQDNVIVESKGFGTLGFASVATGGAGGVGIVQLSAVTIAEAALLGLVEGQEISISVRDPESGVQAPEVKVKVFFSDSETTAVNEAAQSVGVLPPATGDSLTGDPALDALFENIALDTDNLFLGVETGAAVGTEFGPQIPVFTDGDQETFFLGWSPEAIFDFQLKMERAGLATKGSATGLWTPDWQSQGAFIMAFANAHGLTVPGTNRGVAHQFGATGDLTTDDKMRGLSNALQVLGARPRPIPEFETPLRTMPDEVQINRVVDEFAMQKAGRHLNASELGRLSAYFNDQYSAAFGLQEDQARQQYIRDQINQGRQPNVEQARIASGPDVVESINPEARFRSFFEDALSGPIELNERQDSRKRLRNSLFATVSMARRAAA